MPPCARSAYDHSPSPMRGRSRDFAVSYEEKPNDRRGLEFEQGPSVGGGRPGTKRKGYASKLIPLFVVAIGAAALSYAQGRLLLVDHLQDRYTERRSSIDVLNSTSSNQVQCRIMVENFYDFHYEVIEGTIVRYPIPWHELNCSKTAGPVIFEVGHRDWDENLKELSGWLEYYSGQLEGKTQKRADGVEMQFGSALTKSQVLHQNTTYHATVGVSCTPSMDPKEFVRRSDNHYCVMHKLCGLEADDGSVEDICDDRVRQKSCWVSPMADGCYFLPTDLPQFGKTAKCERYFKPAFANRTLNVCVSGRARNHFDLAIALNALKPKDVVVSVHQREETVPNMYIRRGVDSYIRVVRESSFLPFQRSISQCDMLLPLIRPSNTTTHYFPPPLGKGKLSGCLIQALGYKLPMVIHADAKKIYGAHLNAPTLTYTDKETFKQAFSAMLTNLRNDYGSARKAACS